MSPERGILPGMGPTNKSVVTCTYFVKHKPGNRCGAPATEDWGHIDDGPCSLCEEHGNVNRRHPAIRGKYVGPLGCRGAPRPIRVGDKLRFFDGEVMAVEKFVRDGAAWLVHYSGLGSRFDELLPELPRSEPHMDGKPYVEHADGVPVDAAETIRLLEKGSWRPKVGDRVRALGPARDISWEASKWAGMVGVVGEGVSGGAVPDGAVSILLDPGQHREGHWWFEVENLEPEPAKVPVVDSPEKADAMFGKGSPLAEAAKNAIETARRALGEPEKRDPYPPKCIKCDGLRNPKRLHWSGMGTGNLCLGCFDPDPDEEHHEAPPDGPSCPSLSPGAICGPMGRR